MPTPQWRPWPPAAPARGARIESWWPAVNAPAPGRSRTAARPNSSIEPRHRQRRRHQPKNTVAPALPMRGRTYHEQIAAPHLWQRARRSPGQRSRTPCRCGPDAPAPAHQCPLSPPWRSLPAAARRISRAKQRLIRLLTCLATGRYSNPRAASRGRPGGTPIIRRRQRHAWVIATLGYQATGYVSQLEMHVAACLGGRPRHPPPCPRFSSHHRWPCCPAVLLPTCWSVWAGWCKAASGRGDGDTAALRFAAAAGAKRERQRNEHIGAGNLDRSRSPCRPGGQGGRALCPAPDADDAGGAIPG